MIKAENYRFSKVLYGSFVPYGTAGDCYSHLTECQQVIYIYLKLF